MKIQTLHPDPDKQGTNIDKKKYDIIKATIIKVLQKEQPLGFSDLNSRVKEELPDFDGSVGWYFTTVKLDLEAREEISVDRSSSPQMITLA